MIKGFIVAMQFLTRIPIPMAVDFNNQNLKKSIFFFPFVGIIIGLLAGVGYTLLYPINREIAGIVALLSLILISGGLHLDGISDTFDGFFSNKSTTEILEIMKDSRVGAFGVIALILYILTEYVFLKNIPYVNFFVLAIATGNSRLIITYVVSTKKSARPGGMGDMFQQTNPINYFISGLICYLILVLLINPYYIISTAINFIVAELICNYSYKKINGVTGDVFGTIILLGELTSIISLWGIQTWIL